MAESADSTPKADSEKKAVPLAAALKRLNDALDGLEDAASNKNEGDLDSQLQRMADDRSRLGRDLDAAEARASRLKEVNSEVSRRLVGAMETVRSVMEGKG